MCQRLPNVGVCGTKEDKPEAEPQQRREKTCILPVAAGVSEHDADRIHNIMDADCFTAGERRVRVIPGPRACSAVGRGPSVNVVFVPKGSQGFLQLSR